MEIQTDIRREDGFVQRLTDRHRHASAQCTPPWRVSRVPPVSKWTSRYSDRQIPIHTHSCRKVQGSFEERDRDKSRDRDGYRHRPTHSLPSTPTPTCRHLLAETPTDPQTPMPTCLQTQTETQTQTHTYTRSLAGRRSHTPLGAHGKFQGSSRKYRCRGTGRHRDNPICPRRSSRVFEEKSRQKQRQTYLLADRHTCRGKCKHTPAETHRHSQTLRLADRRPHRHRCTGRHTRARKRRSSRVFKEREMLADKSRDRDRHVCLQTDAET